MMSSLYGPIRYPEEELRSKIEFMDSRAYHQQHVHHYNSGLVGIRSDEQASGSEDDHPYSQTLSSETETLLAKLMSSRNGWSHSDSFHTIGDNSVKQEALESAQQEVQNGYAYDPHMSYQPRASGYPNLNFNAGTHFDGSFSMQNSLEVPEYALQPEMDSRNSSSLTRQNSSPPGFFNKSTVENGFAGLTQMGGSRASDIGNGVATININCQNRYLSRENIDAAVHESGILEICDGSRKAKTTGFVNDSWDSGAFSGLKPPRDNDRNMFSICNSNEIQAAEVKQHSHGLCKQLSWPSSSTKMVSAELFQLQGSVQFKVRAKRGFATHPRSIAERIRRTRISEKIKTLEGLFPEMDKQAKTADKLELAVRYIKDLQKKIKMLTSARVKCMCLSEPKQD